MIVVAVTFCALTMVKAPIGVIPVPTIPLSNKLPVAARFNVSANAPLIVLAKEIFVPFADVFQFPALTKLTAEANEMAAPTDTEPPKETAPPPDCVSAPETEPPPVKEKTPEFTTTRGPLASVDTEFNVNCAPVRWIPSELVVVNAPLIEVCPVPAVCVIVPAEIDDKAVTLAADVMFRLVNGTPPTAPSKRIFPVPATNVTFCAPPNVEKKWVVPFAALVSMVAVPSKFTGVLKSTPAVSVAIVPINPKVPMPVEVILKEPT